MSDDFAGEDRSSALLWFELFRDVMLESAEETRCDTATALSAFVWMTAWLVHAMDASPDQAKKLSKELSKLIHIRYNHFRDYGDPTQPPESVH